LEPRFREPRRDASAWRSAIERRRSWQLRRCEPAARRRGRRLPVDRRRMALPSRGRSRRDEKDPSLAPLRGSSRQGGQDRQPPAPRARHRCVGTATRPVVEDQPRRPLAEGSREAPSSPRRQGGRPVLFLLALPSGQESVFETNILQPESFLRLSAAPPNLMNASRVIPGCRPPSWSRSVRTCNRHGSQLVDMKAMAPCRRAGEVRLCSRCRSLGSRFIPSGCRCAALVQGAGSRLSDQDQRGAEGFRGRQAARGRSAFRPQVRNLSIARLAGRKLTTVSDE
jgi:hypothetical protein